MNTAESLPHSLPLVIQGGMGIGVSNWRLARAVSQCGQLGVVSGTALNSILIRRLQEGDTDGAMRRALAACPLKEAAQRIQERYFVEGGKPETTAYKLAPLFSLSPSRDLIELTIVANFCEIYLAKEGHSGVVGLNLLEKIQMPTLASLFGAMLARVDYVLMGAGIPRAIPGILDGLAAWQTVSQRIALEGAAAGEEPTLTLSPADYLEAAPENLLRPRFLAIVSSSTLALTLARKASGRVDGFVVEGLCAGGHNAPPRGSSARNERGEPVYGPRDVPDLAAIKALGLPFWLAGAYATPERLQEARSLGATGVQIGTAFAFCEESGIRDSLKESALAASLEKKTDLFTDPRVSPTGMPFKVLALPGSIASGAVYEKRTRTCDLGYLRQAYLKACGAVGYRCPAEPSEDFLKKGGNESELSGRKCLCNGLLAGVGLGQTRSDGTREPAIVTAGEDIAALFRYLTPGKTRYSAADVLRWLGLPQPA